MQLEFTAALAVPWAQDAPRPYLEGTALPQVPAGPLLSVSCTGLEAPRGADACLASNLQRLLVVGTQKWREEGRKEDGGTPAVEKTLLPNQTKVSPPQTDNKWHFRQGILLLALKLSSRQPTHS